MSPSTARALIKRSSARGRRSIIWCKLLIMSSIGKHCLIVAQSGIAGSTKLGNYVIFGGTGGPGRAFGNRRRGGCYSPVRCEPGSIKAGEQRSSVLLPNLLKHAFRNNAHIQRLDKYVETIKDLKKRVEELEKK